MRAEDGYELAIVDFRGLRREVLLICRRIDGAATVMYEATCEPIGDSASFKDWPKAQGPTVSAAVRALADVIESHACMPDPAMCSTCNPQ
jgi:hypothetical protein